MTELFIKLEQDNDIVMLGKDTFTVSRLKELMTENMRTRLFSNPPNLPNSLCQSLKITDKSIALDLTEFRLVFPLNGTECQLLQLKSGQWISGKIRFQADADHIYSQGGYSNRLIIEAEFAPDEIISNEEEQNNINYDNSLDKIRAELNQMNAI
ncbi:MULTISPECIES: KGK domain-containing protein [Planktothrix]|uniref:KGK domain-containing protein n=1 Tax=Planktothrix TaxID=54304 RepID=UPI00047CCA5B|nr:MULTISPECIES: KGK domain-containing protein [Planktothrix]